MNQGYILDGFPKTKAVAQGVFEGELGFTFNIVMIIVRQAAGSQIINLVAQW